MTDINPYDGQATTTMTLNDERQAQYRTFLHQRGLDPRSLSLLIQDASFRRYFRLSNTDRPILLMDAPLELEDVGQFAKIARHLTAVGLKAPEIIDFDQEYGLLLLEDFGDDTFTRLIAAGTDDTSLYPLAVDVLIALHSHPDAAAIDLPLYDRDLLIQEALLLTDWYAPVIRNNTTSTEMRHSYISIWQEILDSLPEPAHSLVLRDFHVDNLMRVPPGIGTSGCGLLDFQDAVIGPMAYDLVSLLEDARRDINPNLVVSMIQRYHEAMPLLEIENFRSWYHVLGAQRHCKVAGIFLRLLLRDGKSHYVRHIPRVMHLLEQKFNRPELLPLRQWLDFWLPERSQPLPDFKAGAIRQLIGIDDPESQLPRT
ncbi:MAG: phosphotransferase [Pseudomonadota bacterium]|nr:phosphotransferase [Pseudomonadota bacterium]